MYFLNNYSIQELDYVIKQKLIYSYLNIYFKCFIVLINSIYYFLTYYKKSFYSCYKIFYKNHKITNNLINFFAILSFFIILDQFIEKIIYITWIFFTKIKHLFNIKNLNK